MFLVKYVRTDSEFHENVYIIIAYVTSLRINFKIKFKIMNGIDRKRYRNTISEG